MNDSSKCACHSTDARACFLSRHPECRRYGDVDIEDYNNAIDEVCECACHFEQEYDEDSNGL